MDVRIGVTYSIRELELQLDDSTDREELERVINQTLSGQDAVLWLTDRRGKRVGVPADKVAFVELSSPEDSRSIGFGV